MGIRNFLWLVLLASLWGPSFLFIKVAVEEIPPVTLAAGRVGLAALTLYVVLKIQRRGLMPFGPIWKHFAIVGFFSNALPFSLFSWGEQHVDSALAAILNGSTPLFTIILAHIFTSDDHITPAKLGGVLLGFGGLLLLILPAVLGGVTATTWGLIAMAVAAFSYGVAIVYSTIHLRGLPKLVAPTSQLTMAAIYLVPLALIFEQPYQLPPPSLPAIGSLLTLALFGTALAFVLYYRIMENTSATYLSMVTYLVPVFGVILGVAVLNEQLSWNAYAGCALILAGVMTVNGVFLTIRNRLRRFNEAAATP
jgi:drug/metabolite transporter (DMT)-like permease